MLLLEEARAAILSGVSVVGTERVALTQAHGRVLAEPIVAPADHPAFDNSAMDGYAVRWDEVASVSQNQTIRLPVSLEAPAGASPGVLLPGTAARIMTGGPLPKGADTVIMREDTDESEPDHVTIKALPGNGQGAHIRRQGENIHVGQVVLEPGVLLRGGEIGLLATCGKAVVAVRRRPVVAIISTGDELVEVGQATAPGQIINSSGYALAALVQECGAQARVLPIAPDEFEPTRQVFMEALGSAELVVSTGGVSVGDRDVVKDVLEALCAQLSFWKVRVKPGKPLAFGVSQQGKVPLIGVPGNPVSAYVGFWQFVRPAILKAQGRSDWCLARVSARLGRAVRSTQRRLDLQRGVLRADGAGGYEFMPCGDQGSGNLLSTTGINALAHIPIGVGSLEQGQQVDVEVLYEIGAASGSDRG